MKKLLVFALITSVVFFSVRYCSRNYSFVNNYEIGDKIDSLNGVYVYYNGGTGNVLERNTTKSGYNLGLKYQCVEFVKRYYYEYYHHEMPDSYGNAKDFFDPSVENGQLNKTRNLLQFNNTLSPSEPQVGDLIIMDKTLTNPYGHVAIVSRVEDLEFEIIQQNAGKYARSRVWMDIEMEKGMFRVDNDRVLGWLRRK